MTLKRVVLIFLAAVLSGCGSLAEEDFYDGYVTEICRLYECDEDYEMDDCEGTMRGYADGAAAYYGNCTYDPKAAKECLNAIKAETCDSYLANSENAAPSEAETACNNDKLYVDCE